MKILTKEEKKAHETATLHGAFKGAIVGSVLAVGLYTFASKKIPRFATVPWSVKTATCVIPLAATTHTMADNASTSFEYEMYCSEKSQENLMKEYQRWQALPLQDKAIEALSNNKYKVIVGSWGLSLWGSWLYASRDKLLSRAQKFYNARMYAQFFTVGLLLASIGLSMYEEEQGKKHDNHSDLYEDDWKDILEEQSKETKQSQ